MLLFRSLLSECPLSGNSGRYFDLKMVMKRGRFRPEGDILSPD